MELMLEHLSVYMVSIRLMASLYMNTENSS